MQLLITQKGLDNIKQSNILIVKHNKNLSTSVEGFQKFYENESYKIRNIILILSVSKIKQTVFTLPFKGKKNTSKNSTATTALINRVISELREKIFTLWAKNQPYFTGVCHWRHPKKAKQNTTTYQTRTSEQAEISLFFLFVGASRKS